MILFWWTGEIMAQYRNTYSIIINTLWFGLFQCLTNTCERRSTLYNVYQGICIHVCHHFTCQIIPWVQCVTCIANFQWCWRHCSDQIFSACCCASATALPFQWCRISCQGVFHSKKCRNLYKPLSEGDQWEKLSSTVGITSKLGVSASL